MSFPRIRQGFDYPYPHKIYFVVIETTGANSVSTETEREVGSRKFARDDEQIIRDFDYPYPHKVT